MDLPFEAWFHEVDMEDSEFMYHLQQTPSYSEFVDSVTFPNYKGYQNGVTRDHFISGVLDQQESNKATVTSSFAPISGSSANTFTISFGDFTSPTINQNQLYGGYKLECHDAIKCEEEMNLNQLLGSIELPKKGSNTKRNHRQAQEHILAERRRREKLTQRFISLSALLPEIKKMDKATVLEDATKYIKQLQNRVKQLEETSICRKNAIHDQPTPSLGNSKFHGSHEADMSSFDETNSSPCNDATAYNPEIKVRILGRNVLVRIYCQRNSLLPLKALTEMEGLHLTIMCNSVLPISSNSTLITIIAQMSEQFAMTAKGLVKCLQLSLLKRQ